MESQNSSTKKYAYLLTLGTFLLSGYCAYKGLEGATSAIFSTGILTAGGMWANRKMQNAKLAEIEATKKK